MLTFFGYTYGMNSIYRKLYRWYAANGRSDLPWRNTSDPYAIYISEVMLQQTQVKTVLERYYFPFLMRFPTLQALADAPLDAVLKMWEGLGYYSRAKNLHRTAQIAAPQLPDSYDALLKLPGIGKNTASAICAFAYRQKRAVMEANVRRVLCRLYALDDPSHALLHERAQGLLDRENPFDYNQAMMDIGAMVCTVRNPSCESCPFETMCRARELACYDFPVKKRRTVPVRRQIVVAEHFEGRVALMQRSGKFLHGLWGFAESEKAEGEKIGEVRHQYTHFKLEVTLYAKALKHPREQMFSQAESETLALSTVDKKIFALLERSGITSRR